MTCSKLHRHPEQELRLPKALAQGLLLCPRGTESHMRLVCLCLPCGLLEQQVDALACSGSSIVPSAWWLGLWASVLVYTEDTRLLCI